MNILFVHQNYPGQYREILRALAQTGAHRILFLTQRQDVKPLAGVTLVTYRSHHHAAPDSYALSRPFEETMGAAYGAYQAGRRMAEQGFRPDLILGHVGWGELTFLKEIWPDVPILGYWEYYYRAEGGSVGFDPEFPASPDTPVLMRARNALNHLCLPEVDLGQCPTEWQMATFPDAFRDQSYICHDGIRTDQLRPDATASLRLGRLEQPLTRQDEVFTYMARNMEPVRGFHVFMRALPHILAARPKARALIIGGNGTSYGKESGREGGYRAEMEREVGADLDWSRVHFLGRVPYGDFQRVIQLSRCHIYLTVPFVLSWSLLEAMSMGATVVASDTAPVREVIRDGETGILTDFFAPQELARKVVEVLTDPEGHAELGRAARADIVARYDFDRCAAPVHIARMNSLLPRRLQIDMPVVQV